MFEVIAKIFIKKFGETAIFHYLCKLKGYYYNDILMSGQSNKYESDL